MPREQGFGLLARNAPVEVWLIFLHLDEPL
jgi:hypothetical protein